MGFLDLLGVFNKNGYEEYSNDPEILKLRSEPLKKIDCVLTVNNAIKPLLKVINLNIFLFITTIVAFTLLGLPGLFVGLLGAVYNFYFSRKQSTALAETNAKYKVR